MHAKDSASSSHRISPPRNPKRKLPEKIFANDIDRDKYLTFVGFESKRYGLKILAYCLMPNHVVKKLGEKLNRCLILKPRGRPKKEER